MHVSEVRRINVDVYVVVVEAFVQNLGGSNLHIHIYIFFGIQQFLSSVV